jgi:cyanophycinase
MWRHAAEALLNMTLRMDIPNHFWRKRRLVPWGLFLVASALLAAIETHKLQSFDTVDERPELQDLRVSGGSLMIIGGGSVTPEIRRRFVELAGGPEARIVVIPGADPPPGEELNLLSPWRTCGAQSVELVHAANREVATDPAFSKPIREATGVWFGGGYQSLLAERYVDTPVQECLHELLKRNGVVGGCSAGAALLSRVMIRDGDTKPVEARGLDLISNAIIDQHFLKRNRLWRLEQMLNAHPGLIGLGVDEATGLVIDLSTWRLRVVGESYVLACLPGTGPGSQRIEILKRGDDVTLSQLREDHLAWHAAVEPGTSTGLGN